MYLMYHLDDEGKRVYTLQVRHLLLCPSAPFTHAEDL